MDDKLIAPRLLRALVQALPILERVYTDRHLLSPVAANEVLGALCQAQAAIDAATKKFVAVDHHTPGIEE